MGRAVCQPVLPIASHERETSSARYGKNVGEGCLKTRWPETGGVTGGSGGVVFTNHYSDDQMKKG
jgi:hypothetical protein